MAITQAEILAFIRTAPPALSIIGAIIEEMESDAEWVTTCKNDPAITEADAALSRLEADLLQPPFSKAQRLALDDAVTEYVTAYTNAAMLYGMRAGITLCRLAEGKGGRGK